MLCQSIRHLSVEKTPFPTAGVLLGGLEQEQRSLNPVFDQDITFASSVIVVFKTKLLLIIRPAANSLFGILYTISLSYQLQKRVVPSKLNFPKFKHNFRDKISQMCLMSGSSKGEEHFFALSWSYHWTLFQTIIHYLLYGNKNLSNDDNKNMIEKTLNLI